MLAIGQIDRIVAKLSGEGGGTDWAADMQEPWRTMYQRVHPLEDLSMAERELWKAAAGMPRRNELVEIVLAAMPNPESDNGYPSLAEIAGSLRPIDWLWPAWIPRGMVSLLGAAPGAGKSIVALDLARRIIHGEPLPDGTAVPNPGASVLYVDAEGIPQIQNQRAADWGIDRSRLFPMLPPDPYGPLDLGNAKHQAALMGMVNHLQPELVIVDSLSSISLRGENSIEDVRALLHFLSALAGQFGVAVLVIHHLRKRMRGNKPAPMPIFEPVTADDLRGSSHIVAMARSILALSVVQTGPQPDRNGPRRLEVIKSNLCACPPALGVYFEPAVGAASGKLDGTPHLHYDEPPDPYREMSKTESCANWLLEYLAEAEQPVHPQDVLEAAQEMGFGRTVVYRARRNLGARVREEGRKGPRRTWAVAESGGAVGGTKRERKPVAGHPVQP
jgi:hypothetical protein